MIVETIPRKRLAETGGIPLVPITVFLGAAVCALIVARKI